MADERLAVYLGEDRIGTLISGDNAQMMFEYERDYQLTVGVTSLSLSMPLTREQHEHSRVAPFVDGLLPDNETVRDRWGREFGVSGRNPFALLRNVGHDLPGAVRLLSENTSPDTKASMHMLNDSDVASQIRRLREDPSAWHFTFGGRFSLAGAQRKFALRRTSTRWAEPRGDAASTHIVKLAIPEYPDQHINEHLCLTAAYELGLVTSFSEIRTFEDEEVLLVSRYDRWHINEQIVRTHSEDMCQALGVYPFNKYQNDGGPSPSMIASLFREHQNELLAIDSIRRFVDALIFNWLILNPDAHAKNYSVLLRSAQMHLAPLYDLVSVTPYAETHYLPKERLAMKIGSEYVGHKVTGRHWRALAGEVGIDETYVLERVQEMCEEIVGVFESVASEFTSAQPRSDLPAKLVEGIRDQVAVCQKLLAIDV